MSGYSLVLGLGVTGFSVVRYLAGKEPVVAMDSRANPPYLGAVRERFPAIECVIGGFDKARIEGADRIIASPGIAELDALTASAKTRGIDVVSDIDLFADAVNQPVIGITGTNGKSTVTSLTGHLLTKAGRKVGVGGNLGTPALDLIDEGNDCYVLELSSFQLDITRKLRCRAATILNVTTDHLDRYGSFARYVQSKQQIYRQAEVVVFNRGDDNTRVKGRTDAVSFGSDAPAAGHYGVREHEASRYLTLGATRLCRGEELTIRGAHNEQNALAALALSAAVGADPQLAAQHLCEFAALPHRCVQVARLNEVEYINDSKATNIGACLAALHGMSAVTKGGIWLIAGGDGKGADFGELATQLPQNLRGVFTIGQDGERIAAALRAHTSVYPTQVLENAVAQAASLAKPGDCVLLAPACASWDQFRNFEHRGERFAELVASLDGRRS